MHRRDFYDLDQCRMYLEGSIIRFKGIPRYINRCGPDRSDEGIVLEHTSLGGGDNHVRNALTHKDWDFTPCPLGFVNKGKNVYDVCRIPRRMWKVGFNHRNTRINWFNRIENTSGPHGTNSIIYSTSMTACVTNKYPSPDATAKKLAEREQTIAFSRRFAMDSDHNLMYRKLLNVSVGSWKFGSSLIGRVPLFKLNKEYQYLTEILKEDGGTLDA